MDLSFIEIIQTLITRSLLLMVMTEKGELKGKYAFSISDGDKFLLQGIGLSLILVPLLALIFLLNMILIDPYGLSLSCIFGTITFFLLMISLIIYGCGLLYEISSEQIRLKIFENGISIMSTKISLKSFEDYIPFIEIDSIEIDKENGNLQIKKTTKEEYLIEKRAYANDYHDLVQCLFTQYKSSKSKQKPQAANLAKSSAYFHKRLGLATYSFWVKIILMAVAILLLIYGIYVIFFNG